MSLPDLDLRFTKHDFRAPDRPRTWAAATPARVRSRVGLKSNSMRVIKTWKTKIPYLLRLALEADTFLF
jgi:hypothetical protein